MLPPPLLLLPPGAVVVVLVVVVLLVLVLLVVPVLLHRVRHGHLQSHLLHQQHCCWAPADLAPVPAAAAAC
jgi:hypothetical protein